MDRKVIRCHRCGTSKGDEDRGIYICWVFGNESKKGIIVWFHNTECKQKWVKQYNKENYKELSYSKQIGIMPIQNVDNQDSLEDRIDDI